MIDTTHRVGYNHLISNKREWNNFIKKVSVKIRYDHQNRGHSQKIDFPHTLVFYRV